ncbi:MAG: formate acetyltransferase, partial [Actinobacteria bacterium]|nr:formate acetyltransferase [Actinomycetota bacterium]
NNNNNYNNNNNNNHNYNKNYNNKNNNNNNNNIDVLIDKTLSRERAIELIENMLYKADELGRAVSTEYHKTLQGTNMLAVYTIGGVKSDGSDACNELTLAILDAIDDLRICHPDFKFAYHPNVNPKIWKRVVEIVRSGLGQPSIKNNDLNVSNLVSQFGFTLEEARSWAVLACAAGSPTIQHGRCRDSGYAIFPAKILEMALNNGFDPVPLNGEIRKVGPATGDAAKFSSFEELFEAFRKQWAWCLKKAATIKYLSEVGCTAMLKRPFVSCIFHRSFDACRDVMDIPAKSAAYYITPGIVDTIDSLISLKKLVFEDKKYTMSQVLEALKANWEGYETMREDFINTTKYGNDDDFADDIAKLVVSMSADEGLKVKDYYGDHPVANIMVLSWTFTLAPYVGALPNGRKLNDLIADGGGPHAGCDRNGPMAAVLSVSKIDSKRIRDLIFNQKFSESVLSGDAGLKKLQNHIETAMKLGIEMIQFNVVDRENLLKAQKYPEQYQNLVVRVSGYNVRFVDLPRKVQDGIISRTEHVI